jgi:hypothetical protein
MGQQLTLVRADQIRCLAVLMVTCVVEHFGHAARRRLQNGIFALFSPPPVGVVAITTVTSDCFVTSGNSAGWESR